MSWQKLAAQSWPRAGGKVGALCSVLENHTNYGDTKCSEPHSAPTFPSAQSSPDPWIHRFRGPSAHRARSKLTPFPHT
eukprot:scaffold121568_cov105-Phaeocystis_antarctica.AAC.1